MYSNLKLLLLQLEELLIFLNLELLAKVWEEHGMRLGVMDLHTLYQFKLAPGLS